MAFSQSECDLLRQIENGDLIDSLKKIKKAVAAIWAAEAPRIIKGYTDHGITHCERIASYAAALLEARNNHVQSLSEQETYLLLAGIYFHDIGMQCDVARFPIIKHKAEDYGAIFERDFAAATSDSYSDKQQIDIRENHHYLSAAWIHCVYDGLDSGKLLSQAVQSIPYHLLKDLIDICKYHSKLPIDTCPTRFELSATGRKRLVAALLRLSDELDIQANRVTIDVIQMFSFNASNSVYWWLHNITEIEIKGNAIALYMTLHPDDLVNVGDIVQTQFVNRFQRKNEPVLRVLDEARYTFHYSYNSGVRPYEFQQRLPKQILEELRRVAEERVPISPLVPQMLLIEDHPTWRRILTTRMDIPGYDVTPVTTYSEAVSALVHAGARGVKTKIVLCVSDLSLSLEIGDDNMEGKGLLALCQVLRIPSIVVSGYLTESLKSELKTEYGVLDAFDKLGFIGDGFRLRVLQALQMRAEAMADTPVILDQRQQTVLADGLRELAEKVVDYYQAALQRVDGNTIQATMTSASESDYPSLVEKWRKQSRELNLKLTTVIEQMSQVKTLDHLNLIYPRVLNECLDWAAAK